MSLPKCPNCNHRFTWASVYKALWKIDQFIECPNCKTKLYPSLKSRNKVSFLFVLGFFVYFGLQMLSAPPIITIPLLVIIWIIVGLTVPFFYSYLSNEEPPW